ncbi:flavonol 4'-sulfotransferase [Tanacetum coccineum]
MSPGKIIHRGIYSLTETLRAPPMSLGKVARERIPGELSPSTYLGRHVARDEFLQRQVARKRREMSLGIMYQGFWNIPEFLEGGIIVQQSFKAQPNDIFLCSCPKTGTTWLKALAFAIVNREKFNESTSPLLTTMPHECIPFLEKDLKQIEDNHKNSRFPLVATHLSYTSLPESVISSDCKIVYIYRNIKDVINSSYHFILAALNIPLSVCRPWPFYSRLSIRPTTIP